MPEEERLRLLAIAERIALVRGWAEEMDEAAFVADPLTRDAVAMSLLVVGETVRRLPAKASISGPGREVPAGRPATS